MTHEQGTVLQDAEELPIFCSLCFWPVHEFLRGKSLWQACARSTLARCRRGSGSGMQPVSGAWPNCSRFTSCT